MGFDRKTRAEKSPAAPKSGKGARRVAAKTNGKHSLTGYQHIPIGIVETSFDGKYMDVNEEFCRILGYSRDELLQLGIKDCTHEDDYSIDSKLYEQLIAGKIPFYRLEKRFVRKSGGMIWVELTRTLVCDEKEKPLYAVGVVLDISDRKDVEKVLRESVERLRLATETARMFMWEWDFQNYSYILADNFEQVLGFSAGLLPKNRFETLGPLVPEEDLQAISDAFESAVEKQKDLHSLPCRVINPENQQVVWLEVSAKIVYDPEGKPERMFGVAQNITENKKVQDEIAIVSMLPEQNPNPVMRIKPDGTILYANLPSKTMLESWNLQGEQRLPAELQKNVDDVFRSGTKRVIELRQKEKTFSCTLAPILEAGYVNLYGSDITPRKQAEEALRSSEERMRLAIEANRMVAWEWDTVADHVISSENMAEVYGLDSMEKAAAGFSLIWPEDLPAHREKVERVTRQGGKYHSEFRVTRPADGRVLWMEERATALTNAEGQVTRLVGVVTDITERRQAEEKLRESEERFRALVSQSTAGIAQSDPEGRLTFVNPSFCDMLGYSAEELLGKTIWELTYADDREENKRLFRKLMADGESYQFEKRFLRRDGSTRWTSVSVTTVHDASGNPKGGVGVMIDIEHRKRAEKALAEFARQQEALYQLTDKLHRMASLQDVFDASLEAILGALQCDRASILLYDEKDVMRFVAWRGLSEEYRRAVDGHSPWKPDAENPQPIRMDDIRTADLGESLRATIQAEGIGALAFIPLVVNDRLIGKFMIYYDAPHTFDEAELDLSLTIAHQLAFGIDRKRTEQALMRERETLERLFETMPVMVSMLDPETNSMRMNAEFERLLGWKSENVTVSTLLEALYPDPDYRSDVLQRMAAAAGKKEWVEVRVRARDGHMLDSMWSNISIFNGQKLAMGIALGIDITERRQTETRLALLAEISEMLRNVDDPHELMYQISQAVGEHLNLKRVLFNEIDLEHDLEIVHRDYHRGLPSVAGVHKVSAYSSLTSGEVASGKTVVNPDSKTDPRTAQVYEKTYAPSGERSYVVVPMMRDNRWVASLWASDDQPRIWSRDEVSLLETIAERTWTVIEKLRINTALRESEQRFREIFETAGVSVWVEDYTEVKHAIEELRARGVQDLRAYFVEHPDFVQRAVGLVRVIDVNNETLDLFRASSKEVLLGPLSQVFAPETQQIFIEELMALAEGREMVRAETQIRTVDGKPISVLFTVHFAPPTSDQSRVVVTLTDITERKRMEEALRLENERFMRFADSNIVGIVIGDANGRITFANDYYLNLLGVSRQDLMDGKVDWKKFTPPEWLPADEKAIREMNENGACEPYEKEYVRTDGKRVPVYIANAILPGPGKEIAAFVLDVTERKRAEEALRESEERYRGIVNQTIGGIAESDLTGRFTMVNHRFCEITGYTREKLLSELRMQDITHPDDLPENAELFGRLVTEGTPFEIEKRYIRSDGSNIWVHNSVSAITGTDGKPQFAVAAVIDVTERKLAEEQQRRSAEFDAFRVELVDALRPLNDPEKILAEAMRVLGEKLQVNRVLYSEIDDDNETILIVDNYVQKGIPKLTGRASLNDYGKARGPLSTGRNLIIEDAATSPDMDEKDRAAFAALGIHSGLGIPLIKGGRWVATLGVHHGAVRSWTENEIKFVEETAERTWSALERARAQDKLRASESLYRAIARSIPGGGVYVVDKDFRYLVAEGPVTEAFGLGRDMLEGRTVTEVFPDERGARMEERLKRSFAGETVSFETQHDGRVYWTQQAPLYDSIGQAIILTLDITERKRAEEALRESEERFRAILRQATAGIVRKDAEGRLIFVNQAFCNMLGYTEAELLGRTMWSLMHQDDLAENQQMYNRLMMEGIPSKLERRLLRADGSVIWVDASVSPIMDATGKAQSAVTVEVDISGRKQAEEALQQLNLQLEERVLSRTAKLRAVNQILREEIAERKKMEEALRKSEATARENEEKLRTLFELLPVGISFLDLQGQIIEMNPALSQILRLSREQLSDQGYKSRKYIRANGTLMRPAEFASQRALTEGKTVYNVETGVILEDGEVVWTNVSAAPVDVADVGAVVVTADITESKRAERALQESRERLQILSQRLVEVQEEERRAIARELHDRVGQTLAALNINLIIISGQLAGKVDEQTNTRLGDSMKLVAETIALVRDVMSNLRPSVLDDYGLEAAIESYLSQYSSRYEIQTRFDKPDPAIPRLGPSIEMTFLRIAQEALMNCARHARASLVDLSLWREADAVYMTVQDNGMGITSWQEANRPGSHGLTIMRERAEAFGGSLSVSSTPGKGTKVEVRIPIERNDPSQGQKEMNE